MSDKLQTNTASLTYAAANIDFQIIPDSVNPQQNYIRFNMVDLGDGASTVVNIAISDAQLASSATTQTVIRDRLNATYNSDYTYIDTTSLNVTAL